MTPLMLPWRGLSQDPYPYYLPNRSGTISMPKNSWRNAWMMRSDAFTITIWVNRVRHQLIRFSIAQ